METKIPLATETSQLSNQHVFKHLKKPKLAASCILETSKHELNSSFDSFPHSMTPSRAKRRQKSHCHLHKMIGQMTSGTEDVMVEVVVGVGCCWGVSVCVLDVVVVLVVVVV